MVSEGIGKQLGRRNAPTTMNAALLHTQFWDGREKTLEDQAGQPILNPIEMGMPNREAVVDKLRAIPEYVAAFQKAYGRAIEYQDIQRAIAAFERTLMFLDAPFDRFLAGDAGAVSADAKAGWDLFNGRGRCVACHQITYANPLGTDNRFHNIGVSARHQDFEGLAKKARAAMAEPDFKDKLDALALSTDLSELGRFMVTNRHADIGAFRTSQLRNIGITAPYMHDGSMQTLWDTVDHYNRGGEANLWLDGGIEPLALSDQEIDQLVAFMFTLTDLRFAEDNAKEMERQKGIAADKRPFRDDDLAQRRKLPFEDRVMKPTAPHGEPI
jgi:cytochrome c peroxidase